VLSSNCPSVATSQPPATRAAATSASGSPSASERRSRARGSTGSMRLAAGGQLRERARSSSP
jgi:hypothetical protein